MVLATFWTFCMAALYVFRHFIRTREVPHSKKQRINDREEIAFVDKDKAIKKKRVSKTRERHVKMRAGQLTDVQMTSLWPMEVVWREVQIENLSVNVTSSPEIQDCVTVVQNAPSWVMDGVLCELLKDEVVTVAPVLDTHDCVTAVQIASPWVMEGVCHAVQREKLKLTMMAVFEAQNCVTVVQIVSPWVIGAQTEGAMVTVSNTLQPQYCVTGVRMALPWIVENVWRVAKKGELKLTVMAVLEAPGCVTTVKMGSWLVMDAVWHELKKERDVVTIKPMLKGHDSIVVTQRGSPWVIEDEWCKMQRKKIKLTIAPALEAHDCVTALQIVSPLSIVNVSREVQNKQVNVALKAFLEEDCSTVASSLAVEAVCHELPKDEVLVTVKPELNANDCVKDMHMALPRVIKVVWHKMKKEEVTKTTSPVLEAQGCVQAAQIVSSWVHGDVCHEVQDVKWTPMAVLQDEYWVPTVQIPSSLAEEVGHREWWKEKALVTLKPVLEAKECVTVVQMAAPGVWHEMQREEVKSSASPVLEAQSCVQAVQIASSWPFVGKVQEKRYNLTLMAIFGTPDFAPDAQMASLYTIEDVWLAVQKTKVKSTVVSTVLEAQDCSKALQMASPWCIKHALYEIQKKKVKVSVIIVKAVQIVPHQVMEEEAQGSSKAVQIASPRLVEDDLHEAQKKTMKLTMIAIVEAHRCVKAVQLANKWVMGDVSSAAKVQYIAVVQNVSKGMLEVLFHEVQVKNVLETVTSILEVQDCLPAVQFASTWVMEDLYNQGEIVSPPPSLEIESCVSKSVDRSSFSGRRVYKVERTPPAHCLPTVTTRIIPSFSKVIKKRLSKRPSFSIPLSIHRRFSLKDPTHRIIALCPPSSLPDTHTRTSWKEGRAHSGSTGKHIRPLMSIKCFPSVSELGPCPSFDPGQHIGPVMHPIIRPLSDPCKPLIQEEVLEKVQGEDVTECVRPISNTEDCVTIVQKPSALVREDEKDFVTQSVTKSFCSSTKVQEVGHIMSPAPSSHTPIRDGRSDITEKHIRPLMSIKCSPPGPKPGPCSSFNRGQHIRPVMPPVRSQTPPVTPPRAPVRPLMTSRSPTRCSLETPATPADNIRPLMSIKCSPPGPKAGPCSSFNPGQHNRPVMPPVRSQRPPVTPLMTSSIPTRCSPATPADSIRPLMSIKCSPPGPKAGPCSSFNPGQHTHPVMPPVRSQRPPVRRYSSPRQVQGIVPSLPWTAPTPYYYQGNYYNGGRRF